MKKISAKKIEKRDAKMESFIKEIKDILTEKITSNFGESVDENPYPSYHKEYTNIIYFCIYNDLFNDDMSDNELDEFRNIVEKIIIDYLNGVETDEYAYSINFTDEVGYEEYEEEFGGLAVIVNIHSI